jgi:hypothetical protein
MNKTKLLVSVSIFSVLAFAAVSFFSHKVWAYAGPVGLNMLIAEPGPSAAQVTLHWTRYNPDVDNYSIMYGTSPGHYQYGAASIGNTVVYTVGYLQPGVRYYFLIQGYSKGNALPLVTPEISEVASFGPHTVVSTAGPYGQRQLKAVAGPGPGQVTLTWYSISSATNDFNLVYGTKTGSYQYGAISIAPASTVGVKNTYTVSALARHARYYFAVIPVRNNEGIYASGEVSQVAP